MTYAEYIDGIRKLTAEFFKEMPFKAGAPLILQFSDSPHDPRHPTLVRIKIGFAEDVNE